MSYSPLIKIKTENDATILSCEYATHSLKEHELLDTLERMVQQGMAIYLEGSKWDCYPSVLSVPKVTESVKGILIPIIERLIEHDKAMSVAQFHFERTADEDGLKQEHEEWGKQLNAIKKENITGLEALKSFPIDEGLIIKAWGTL